MSPILGYWKIKGLVQPTRLLLEYLEEKYEEHLYERDEGDKWRNKKFELGLEFPNLPYYIDGDVKLTQSMAIIRYIADKHNMLGGCPKERAEISMLEGAVLDIRYGVSRIAYSKDFETLKVDFLSKLPEMLKMFEDRLCHKTYLNGDHVTHPDFMLYDALDVVLYMDPMCLDAFPKLVCFKKRIEAIPQIDKYLKSSKYIAWPLQGWQATFGGGDHPPKSDLVPRGSPEFMASLFAPVEGRAGPLKVTTDSGPVKGSLVDGVAQFKGIPYAAPPVGKLRWRPPKRPEPWTQVRDATEFGPTCLQVTTLGPFAGPPSMEEDCLYLNVYSPNVDPDGKGKLPVIMWIHGGGNLDGASNGYDGSKLARQGHVVVVTINYRLGLLGFMAHPAIDAEGHPFANYGILDQQEAMRWIKRNIAAFGGDKNNVTIGGQSAGSVDSETHVMSPLAKGLFHRAIYQSVLLEPESLESAQAKGKAFSVAAGCGSGEDEATARCLRNLTARQIYDLSGTASTQASYISSIVQDGKIIPGQYLDAIEKGDFNHVPLLSGTTKDELTFAIGITEYFSGPPRVATSEADFEAAVNSYGGAAYPAGTLKKVRQFYPLESYPSPGQALNRLLTDPLVCQHRAHNQAYVGKVPIYYYEFADRTAPSIFPKMPGFEPLAYHTGDIQYVFPGWHGGDKGVQHELNAQQEELSDEIVASWTNFAWTGNPNGQGNRPWPKYSNEPNRPSILSQNVPTSSVISDAQFNAEHQCDFWESISHWLERPHRD